MQRERERENKVGGGGEIFRECFMREKYCESRREIEEYRREQEALQKKEIENEFQERRKENF